MIPGEHREPGLAQSRWSPTNAVTAVITKTIISSSQIKRGPRKAQPTLMKAHASALGPTRGLAWWVLASLPWEVGTLSTVTPRVQMRKLRLRGG